MFPSGSRAEKLPAVPWTRLVRKLSCATQSRSALISSAVPLSGDISQHLGVHAVDWSLAAQDPPDVVGDQLGVVGFRVVRRAADVGRQHDVVQLLQRMVGGQVLALEMVEAGAAEVSRLECG